MKYIAVVCRLETDISQGTDGAWTAFIGVDQEDVITRALRHRQVTALKYPDYSYTVLVGELEYEATPKADYKLRPLKVRLT